MAETTTAKRATTRPAKSKGFTDEERAAMRARAREVKAASRHTSRADKEAADQRDLLEKIGEMVPADRKIAERLHALITEVAPGLKPRTWYGMPAYAKDDKVLCFFKPAAKFKTRYATLGFSDRAQLDSGAIWPTEFAVTELSADVEKKVRTLVKKAAA